MASGTIIQMNRTKTEGATIRRAARRVDWVDMGVSGDGLWRGRADRGSDLAAGSVT
jgi:hypothetical protein